MTKGTHAYWSMQLGTQTPGLEPAILTLEPVISIPEPVITPSSSKCGFSSLSNTTASSSTTFSNKRVRNTPSTSMAVHGLQSCIESFTNKVEDAFRTPLPLHSPCQSTVSLMTNCLYQSIRSSKLNEGGVWLSDPEVYQLFDLFSRNNNISSIYAGLLLATPEDETFSHGWLWDLLENMAHVHAPGGSEAPWIYTSVSSSVVYLLYVDVQMRMNGFIFCILNLLWTMVKKMTTILQSLQGVCTTRVSRYIKFYAHMSRVILSHLSFTPFLSATDTGPVPNSPTDMVVAISRTSRSNSAVRLLYMLISSGS